MGAGSSIFVITSASNISTEAIDSSCGSDVAEGTGEVLPVFTPSVADGELLATVSVGFSLAKSI